MKNTTQKILFKIVPLWASMWLLQSCSDGTSNNTQPQPLNLPTDNIEELNDIAIEKYRDGEYDEAKTILYHIASTEYNTAIIQNDISLTCYRQGAYNEAIDAANKALDMATTQMDSARAFYNIGISYYEKYKYNTAISYLEKAVELDPCDRRIYALGEARDAQKNARRETTLALGTLVLLSGGFVAYKKMTKQK